MSKFKKGDIVVSKDGFKVEVTKDTSVIPYSFSGRLLIAVGGYNEGSESDHWAENSFELESTEPVEGSKGRAMRAIDFPVDSIVEHIDGTFRVRVTGHETHGRFSGTVVWIIASPVEHAVNLGKYSNVWIPEYFKIHQNGGNTTNDKLREYESLVKELREARNQLAQTVKENAELKKQLEAAKPYVRTAGYYLARRGSDRPLEIIYYAGDGDFFVKGEDEMYEEKEFNSIGKIPIDLIELKIKEVNQSKGDELI